MGPGSLERRRPISMIRRAIRLEVVDADFIRGVHFPSGLGKERRHVTRRAARWAVEELLTMIGTPTIEAPCGWRRRRNRQLVELERGKPRRHAVVAAWPRVAHAGPRSDRKLFFIVQPRIEKAPRPM